MWGRKRLLEEIDSAFNGRIQVVHQFGSARIEAGGLLQSGGVLNQIWKKGLKFINHDPLIIKHVLILGLGGGTVAQLISQTWPEAKITAVEIDPVMVKLAKKYFDLDKIPNLKIKTTDAIKFISHQPSAINHDLIIVDLYHGDQIPAGVKNKKFLTALKRVAAENGLIVFNHLFYGVKKKQAQEFISRLEKVFPEISLQRVFSNLMIYCFLK